MGSFSYTCTLSGLPIEAGDDVRYLLLSANPYDEMVCSMHDRWFPRTFPLRCKYNDYGSVDRIEEGPARDIWMEAFKIDIRKRGWGDNSCHDVPTSKDMSFDAMLGAVLEGRIKVRRDVNDEPLEERSLKMRGKIPRGIATIQRVQDAIAKGELPFFDGNWGRNGFLVDLVTYGTVRVRWHSGNDTSAIKKLEAAQKLLSEFATVIRASERGYSYSADLMVFTKPGTKDFHTARDRKGGLLVQQAMIREDVWRSICNMGIDGRNFPPYKKQHVTVETYHKFARELWTESIERWELITKWKASCKDTQDASLRPERLDILLYTVSHGDNPVGWWAAKDAIPFTVGLGTNWRLMIQKYAEGGVTEAQVTAWLENAAEFTLIQQAMMPVRYWWRPSYSCGPQLGEWREHANMLTQFAAIADRQAAEQEAEQKKWAGEEAEDEDAADA